jgi:nitroreductase
MNIFEAMMTRRSVRKFEKTPVDDKLVGVMLYMATQSPSAGNVQEWEFVVVKDGDLKKKIADAALNQDFLVDAPVVIVVCANLEKISLKYRNRGELLYSIQDTANAAMSILLSAHALGLGSCWIGSFDEERVKDILELPEKLRPLVVLPVGYTAEQPKEKSRIPFENLTYFNKYNEKFDIAYLQPGAAYEVRVKPIANYIKDAIKKHKKAREKEKKPVTFKEFLKRLSK